MAILTLAMSSMAAPLETADNACYAEKSVVRNRVVIYQALSATPSCTN